MVEEIETHCRCDAAEDPKPECSDDLQFACPGHLQRSNNWKREAKHEDVESNAHASEGKTPGAIVEAHRWSGQRIPRVLYGVGRQELALEHWSVTSQVPSLVLRAIREQNITYNDHGNTPCSQDANVDMHSQLELGSSEDFCVEEQNSNLHERQTDHKRESLNPQRLERYDVS